MDNEKLVTLVRALQNGDNTGASTIYNVFYNDIYYFILKTVKDPDLASDLTQDTFIEILETIGNLRVPAAFVPWSKKIAYHRCTGYLRKRKDLLADEQEDGYSILDLRMEERREFIPDESLDQDELQKTICSMIDALPEEQRNAIIMRYYDEISIKDIAKIQNTTEGTVKSRLNYGRKAIKQSVEEYEKRNNVKLRCVGVVPVLLWFFKEKRLSDGISLTQLTPTAEIFSSLITKSTKAFSKKILAAIMAALCITGGTGIALNANLNEPASNSTEAEYSEETFQNQTGETEDTESQEESETISTEIPDASHSNPNANYTPPPDGFRLTLSEDETYYSVTHCSSDTNITIPSEYNGIPITSIIFDDSYANLSGITLSENITEIEIDPFLDCTSLSSIIISEDNPVFHSSGNCIIETATKTLVFGCKDSVIPDDGSVKIIGPDAFNNCAGLTDIMIPNTITGIEESAFSNSGLINLTLPDSVMHIGNNAFAKCSNLTSVTFSNNLYSIDYAAFSNCSSLLEVTLPSSLTEIGYGVFNNCSSLNQLSIAEDNFRYHSSGNCIIETENKWLVIGCNNSTIPSDGSVNTISNEAFASADSITGITIPNSIIAIHDYALSDCSNLKEIYYSGTIEQWNSITISDDLASLTIHCTDGDITF